MNPSYAELFARAKDTRSRIDRARAKGDEATAFWLDEALTYEIRELTEAAIVADLPPVELYDDLNDLLT
jgi:hypothetical protein